jgi:hypothetical protein
MLSRTEGLLGITSRNVGYVTTFAVPVPGSSQAAECQTSSGQSWDSTGDLALSRLYAALFCCFATVTARGTPDLHEPVSRFRLLSSYAHIAHICQSDG